MEALFVSFLLIQETKKKDRTSRCLKREESVFCIREKLCVCTNAGSLLKLLPQWF